MRADRDELMRTGKPAQHGIVADVDVARQSRDIGESRVIPHLAIVRDVHVSHDPVVVADARDPGVLRRAAVERAILPDGVAVADLQRGRLPRVFLVLRRPSEHAESENAVLRSYAGSSLDHDVRTDRRALAGLNVLADD